MKVDKDGIIHLTPRKGTLTEIIYKQRERIREAEAVIEACEAALEGIEVHEMWCNVEAAGILIAKWREAGDGEDVARHRNERRAGQGVP